MRPRDPARTKHVVGAVVAAGLLLVPLLLGSRDRVDQQRTPGATVPLESYAVDGAGSLEVVYLGGTCFTDYELVTTEGPEVVDVAIRLVHLPNPEQLACPAVLTEERRDVVLDDPLGDRRVESLGHAVRRTR